MNQVHFGVPKETKTGEGRIAVTPDTAKKIVAAGHQVTIESGAGVKAGFPDEKYQKAGAQIGTIDEVYKEGRVVVKVKEPQPDEFDLFKSGQTLLGYLHVEKGQSPELLNFLKNKNLTAYAFEEMRDPQTGFRTISQGVEAGIVGMFEGLRAYGQILDNLGRPNPFKNLKSMRSYGSKEDAYRAIGQIPPRSAEFNICIAGYGNVSRGCREVLAHLKTPKQAVILAEKDTHRTKIVGQDYAYIHQHLKGTHIFVNAVVWQPGQPPVLTKSDLELMLDNSLIVDISCDEAGGIQTCKPTTWDNPTYVIYSQGGKRIHHYCVDNLPAAMAHDSSKTLSREVLLYLLAFGEKGSLDSGLMTTKGEFVFKSKK